MGAGPKSLWVDDEYDPNFHFDGSLACLRPPNPDEWTYELFKQWLSWLATAGLLLDFVEPPPGTLPGDVLRAISEPVHRWLYLLFDFVRPDRFTWDLTKAQFESWWHLCNRRGSGHHSHRRGGELVPGGAPGKLIPIGELVEWGLAPTEFHAGSQIKDVVFESEKVLARIVPDLLQTAAWENPQPHSVTPADTGSGGAGEDTSETPSDEVDWSQFRSPSEWLTLLRDTYKMSDETFRKMRKGKHKISLRQHPDSTRKSVSLSLSDLEKVGYTEDENQQNSS